MKQCTKSVTVIKKDPTCINRLLDTSEEEEVEDVVFKHFPTRRRKIKPTKHTTFYKLHPSTTLLPPCEYDDYDDEDNSNAKIRILVMADTPATRRHATIPKYPTTKVIPEICKTKSISNTKEYSTKKITYQSNPHKGYKRSTLNESSTLRSTELASKHSILVLKISLHDNHMLHNKSSTTGVTVSRKMLSNSPETKTANKNFSCCQNKVTTRLTKPISSPPTKALKSDEVHVFHNKSSKQHSTATTIHLESPDSLPPVKVYRLGEVQGVYNKSSTEYSKKRTTYLSSRHILSQINVSTLQTGHVSQIRLSRGRPLLTAAIRASTSAKILTLQSNQTSAKILMQSNQTSEKTLTLQSNQTSAKIPTLQSKHTEQVETHTEHLTEPVTNPYVSTIISLLFQGDQITQVKTSTESSTGRETNNKFSPLQMALTLQSNQMEQMKANTVGLIQITTANPLSLLNQVEQVMSSTECSTVPPINSLISLLKMLSLTANSIEEMKSSAESSTGTRVCVTAPYLSSPRKGATTLITKDQLKKYEQPLKEAYATTETLEWNSAFRIFASLIQKAQLEGMEASAIQTNSPATRANSKLNGSSSQMSFYKTTRKVQSGGTKLVSQYSPAARINFLTGHSSKTFTTTAKNKLPDMNICSSPGLHSPRTTFLENNSTLLENNSTLSVKLPTRSIQRSFSEKDKYSRTEQHSNTTRPRSQRNGLPQTERSSKTRKRYSIIEQLLKKKGRSVSAMINEYPAKHKFKRSVDNIKKAPSETSTKTKLLALDFTKQIPEMREDITLPTLRPVPLEVTEDFSNDLEYDRDPVLDFDTENSDDLLDEMEMITPEEETKFTPKSRLPVSRHFEVESETIPIRHNTMESWPVSQPPQTTPTQIASRLKINISSNIYVNKGNRPFKEKLDECLRSVPDMYIHPHAMLASSDLLVPYAVTYPEEMTEHLKTSPYNTFSMNTIYPVEPTQVNNQPALDTKLNMLTLINNMVKNALENKAAETPETVVMVITVKNEDNATDSAVTPVSEVITNLSNDVRYHNLFETYHPEVINKEKSASVINNPETFITSTPEVPMNFVGLNSPIHYTLTTSAVEVPKNLPYLNSSLHNTFIIFSPEVARNLAYLNIPLDNTSITSAMEVVQEISDLNNTFNSTYRKYTAEPAKDLSGLRMLNSNTFQTSAPEVAEISDLKYPFHKVSMISVPEVANNFSDLKSSFQKISMMSAPKIAKNFSYFWRPFQNISTAPVQEVGKKLYGSVGRFLTMATPALPSLRNLESSTVNFMNISKVVIAPHPETHMAFFPFAIQNSELSGSKNSLPAADQNLMISSITKNKCNFTTKAKSAASVHIHVTSQTSQQTKSTVTSGTSKLTTGKNSPLNVPYFKGEDEEDNVNDYTVYTHSLSHTKTIAKSKTQKTSHCKTQTSSISLGQPTSVSSSEGKFHVIRTTLLYPKQSVTSTTVTGRRESKRSMTTASEPTGDMLKCISIESVIQNKSIQISTSSTPTKLTEKIHSPDHPPALMNKTYVSSSSPVVPPKYLIKGLMKNKAVKSSSRPSVMISRSVSEVNSSEISTNGTQDPASIQIMLPKSLITDWLTQNKTHESSPEESECQSSDLSTNSTQTLSSALVVLIQNKTVAQTLPKSIPECHYSVPPSSNVTYHVINKTQEAASVTDKSNRTLAPPRPPITLPECSVTDNQVLLQNKTVGISHTISKSVPEFHFSEIPPPSNVTHHLINIPHGAFSSPETALVFDKSNRTLAPSRPPITLPGSSVTDNQVLLQNKTVEISQTICKSVPEYHLSEIPPSSSVTHHLINITQGAFSSLQTASLTDKCATQTSTERTLASSRPPITLPDSSVADNQVLVQNKTMGISQTISKSVPEYHSSEIPPSSDVTHHLMNIVQGAFSSLQTASVTDKCATHTSTERTLASSRPPITLPDSSVTDNQVLIQNKTVGISQTICKSVPEYHSSEIPPSSNVTHHLINITQGAFTSLQTALVSDKSVMQTSTDRTLASSRPPITLPECSVTDNQVPIQNKAMGISQTISKSVPEYHSSEIPPSSNVTHHQISTIQVAYSSLQTALVTDKSVMQTSSDRTLASSRQPITLSECLVTDNQVLIQDKTMAISQTIPKSVPEYHSSEIPPSSNVTYHLINISQGAFSSLQTASVTDKCAMQTSTERTLAPSRPSITLPECSVTDNQVLIQNKTMGISQTISKSVPEYHYSETPPSNVTHHVINITQGAFSSLQTALGTDKCASTQVLIQMKTMPISQSSSATFKPVSGFHPSEVLTTPAFNVPCVNSRISEYHSSEIPPSSNVTHHLINIPHGAFSSLNTGSVTDKCVTQISTNRTLAPSGPLITLSGSAVTDSHVLIQNKTEGISQTVSKSVPECHSSEIPPSSNVTHHLINITQGAFSSLETASVPDKCASTQGLIQMKTMVISQSSSSATSKPVSGLHPSEVLTAPAFNVPSVNITHQTVSETLQVITQKSSQFQTGLLTGNVNGVLIQTNTTCMPPVTTMPVLQPSQKEISTMVPHTTVFSTITHPMFLQNQITNTDNKTVIHSITTQLPSSSVTFKEIKELCKEQKTTLPPSEAKSVNITPQEMNIKLASSTLPVTTPGLMITDKCISYEIMLQKKTAKITTQLPSSSVTSTEIKEPCKEESRTLSILEAKRVNNTLHEMNIKLASSSLPVTAPELLITDKCISYEMMIQNKTSKITSSSSTEICEPISEKKPPEITFNSSVMCTVPYQNKQMPTPCHDISKVIWQPNQKMSLRASLSNSVTNKLLIQNNAESDSDKALIQNISKMPFPAMTSKPIQNQKSAPPPPTVDIPAIYFVTDNIFNSIINEMYNKNKTTHKDDKMLIQSSAVKKPDQHEALTPTVYIITDSTPRNKSNEIVTHNKMKNVVNKILKQTFTAQTALSAPPESYKSIQKPHLQKIPILPAYGAPPVNTATDKSDEILILSKPVWLGHQILIQNNTAQLPLSRYSVALQPVQQSPQADILRESSFGAPPTNIFAAMSKKIPIQNISTSKSCNLKNDMAVDNMNKWISKEIMKLKTALPYRGTNKENMDIKSLQDDVQKSLSKEIMMQKTTHFPSRSSLVVNDFSHLKQESFPNNTLSKKTTGIPSIMRSVVLYPLSPVTVTTKKAATVSIKQREHATYYDEEDEEPDEMLSGLSVTLEEIKSMKGENRSRHSFNPQPEIIYSPSHITTQSSSPEKFQGLPCHILQLPLHPTAAFPYKENHLPLFYIPHIPFNLLNVATPSSLYANETTPLVLILIPGSMQGEPWMTHKSSLPSTTEFTKYRNETVQTEAGILHDSLPPSSTKSTRCKTGTTMNIHSQKSHITERLNKTTPSSKRTLKPGFITNILGSTISLTLHNRTKLTSCPYLTSTEMHEKALEHSVPGTTHKISLSETSSAKIKLQSKPSTTTRSKYARNKSSTTKTTTAKPKKLTTININKLSSNGDKCISHLTTVGNNVYRSSKPPHSFTEIIYNRLEEDEDEEPGSTLISVPLTTAKIMIEPKPHKRVKRTSALTTYFVKSPVKIMIVTDDENNVTNAEGIENLVNRSAELELLGEKLDNFRDLKKKRYFIYLEKDKPNVTFSKSSDLLRMCSVDGVVDDFSSYALHDPSHFIQVIENYNCSKYIAVPGQIKLTNEARPRMARRGGNEVQELSRNSMSVNEADLQSIISTSQVTQTDNQMFLFPGSSAVISCQGSSRKMHPQDTPNTMYRWKREDGQEISGQHSWETAYGELCLNNVGAEDAGRYVCHSSSFNPNSEKEEEHSYTHHISVVLLPKYLHQVMVHYHAEPTCEDIDVDLLKLFLPEIVGEHLCGSRELCKVEVVQPYCYRGMRGEMYLSLTIVIRDAALYSLLPVLNQTFCGMTCKGKADAKFVLLMNHNLAAFFKSPIHSRLSYRSANFTPVESSFSSRMMTGCRAGFQLEQGFCEPCPADWYSEEDSAQCNKCGAGKYQPRPGSSMCLKCPHPFAARKCLSLFHQQYAYMAMALVSLLIVKVLVLYLGMQFCKPFLLWYKKQRERKSIPDEEAQSWERSRYTDSRRSRRREERHVRASRSQLYYYQPLPEEKGGCSCKRQRYHRSSKHKIPPKPPPPDFF